MFGIARLFVCCLVVSTWSGNSVSAGDQDRGFGCQPIENSLCLSGFDGVSMILYDCVTAFEGGFPAITMNVPPGSPLRFSIVGNPDSSLTRFTFVTEAVANGNGVDACVGGPGVFFTPVAIEANTNPNPTIHEIPSSVIDEMVAAVGVDGFVVSLSMGCPGADAFAGFAITRNPPPSGVDISLSAVSTPSSVPFGSNFDLTFLITGDADTSLDVQ
ncbi:MAG: hypothetical protein QNK37_26785 [Acidobacteriota bacterium]|nr:hypothetical protein [Acidobacteriota bacterium]